MSSHQNLLLIRHAETDLAGTFCGQSDPPVNANGALQINGLVARLRKEPVDIVYTSDLQRAHSTAKALADSLSIQLRIRAGLRELSFGEWEGLAWEQCESVDPQYAQRWVAEFPNLAAPKGEEFAIFKERVLQEFDTIAAAHESAAIVTHAGVLREILTERCGWDSQQAWRITRPYCCVFHCRDGEARPYV